MPSVDLQSVAFGYDAERIFQDLTFSVSAPCVVTVIGRSGSGKSTLLKLIAGVLAPHSGEIHIATERVAWVPQNSGLFPWLTIGENIRFPLSLSRAPGANATTEDVAASLANDLGIAEVLNALPKNVSGGQAQRAAIGRALAAGAGVTLWDEPFSALDGPSRADLRRLLRRITYDRNLVTFLATHDLLDTAFVSDRILLVEGHPLRAVDEIEIEPCGGPLERSSIAAAALAAMVADRLETNGRGGVNVR